MDGGLITGIIPKKIYPGSFSSIIENKVTFIILLKGLHVFSVIKKYIYFSKNFWIYTYFTYNFSLKWSGLILHLILIH